MIKVNKNQVEFGGDGTTICAEIGMVATSLLRQAANTDDNLAGLIANNLAIILAVSIATVEEEYGISIDLEAPDKKPSKKKVIKLKVEKEED